MSCSPSCLSDARQALAGFKGSFGLGLGEFRRKASPPALPLPSAQPTLSRCNSPLLPAVTLKAPAVLTQPTAAQPAPILPPMMVSPALMPSVPEVRPPVPVDPHKSTRAPEIPGIVPLQSAALASIALQGQMPFELQTLDTNRSWLSAASGLKQAVLEQIHVR